MYIMTAGAAAVRRLQGGGASAIPGGLPGANAGMAAATRVPAHVAAAVVELAPGVTYHQAARILVLKSATTKQQRLPGSVALVCAGTADTAVVEECRLMLASCGCYAFKLAESGVMGMHRIVQVRRRRACRTGKL